MARQNKSEAFSPDKSAAPGVAETLDAIRAGRMTAQQAVATCHERALEIDPDLAAFTIINGAPFRPNPSLALDGIAGGVKDLYDTAGLPTTYGSAIYRDNRPQEDAWLVGRLKELGAFVAGKTVTTEFAWRQAGPTVNPFNKNHTPGGSSSGSAAAVAAGIVPLALGTQTFGSVIRPAAFCGVVGFKPSYGELPLTGVHPLSPTLDHAGYFARSIGDARLIHALVLGRDEPATRATGTRLRVVRTPFWGEASPRQKAALDDAAALLGKAGFFVTPHELPAPFDGALEVAETILCHEAAAIYRPLVDQFPDLVSGHIRELVLRGESLPASAYRQAIGQARGLRDEFAREMENYDAVLTLPALGEAPLLSEGTGNAGPCVLWTLLGVPSVTLPWGFGAHGLPVGIQLAGKAGNDFRLLDMGAQIETQFYAHHHP
ncbi:MAG: amidase [Mesorhizobium sp.]